MKRIIICTAAAAGVFLAVALVGNRPAHGQGQAQDSGLANRVQRGLAISPVGLNFKGKDFSLVGLGSYIINAQGGCNDCHTCPSYTPGHNPFPPPAGVSGDGLINSANYMAGGVNFGLAISANLTPDTTGKPAGLTLDQFITTIKTGHDPVRNDNLTIMPWPTFRNMLQPDLTAIYTYLSAIPPATPGTCSGAGQ